MAYGKYRRYNRGGYRYKRKSTGVNWMWMAKKGYQLAKKAVSLVNAEYKYLDMSGLAATINTNPNITTLSNMARGTGESQRIGSSVLAKSLQMRLVLRQHASATKTTMRVMVIKVKDDLEGSAPTGTAILENVAAGYNLISPLNKDNSSKWWVLMDKVYHLNVGSGTEIDIKKYFTFGMTKDKQGNNTVGHHVTFDTSDAIAKGHVFIMFISNETTNVPTVDWFTRLNYIDN